MIQYILECIAFQLVFLVIYDVFLKGETFFQWNRFYLIATYTISMVLPWIKLEVLKTSLTAVFQGYPDFLWNLDQAAFVVKESHESAPVFPWHGLVLYLGMLLAALLFGYKWFRIASLKRQGQKEVFADFTQYIIANSGLAFSFFKAIFLGDKVLQRKHNAIIAHELVHIRQGHTWDLLFFELMRIVSWFNPLVYVYQNRISALHEFIADAQVAKERKAEHYHQLLSEVFQTEHISFTNQFFTSSLIKKRIVMLQKAKSRKIGQLKYLVLVPIITGMLTYTSCESGLDAKENLNATTLKGGSVAFANIDKVPIFPGCEDAQDPRACFNEKMIRHISKNFNYPQEAQELGIEGRVIVIFTIDAAGNIQDIEQRGPHKLLEDEVNRILSRLPKMEPGQHQGKAVAVPFSIPVTFQLQGGEDHRGKYQDQNATDTALPNGPEERPVFFLNGEETTFAVIESLKPTDIEAVVVLKGEQALEKYGEKGKNGVVELTLATKK